MINYVSKQLLFIFNILVSVILLSLVFSCKNEKKIKISPTFNVGDCVIYNQKRGEIENVSDKPMVGAKEFLYDISLDEGGSRKAVLESNLKFCDED